MKKLIFTLTLVSAAPLLSSNGFGNEIDCENADTQFEMNYCAAEDYTLADKTLNETYRNLYASINDKLRRDLLKTSQLKWIKFRDSYCEFEADYYGRGGTIYNTILYGCLSSLTKAQTKKLKSFN